MNLKDKLAKIKAEHGIEAVGRFLSSPLARIAQEFSSGKRVDSSGVGDPFAQLDSKAIGVKGIEHVSNHLAGYEFPMAPEVGYRGLKHAKMADDNAVSDALAMFGVRAMSASGINVEFEIPIAVRDGAFMEPAVMLVNGSPRIMCQAEFDKMLNGRTFEEPSDVRGGIYAAPLDRETRDQLLMLREEMGPIPHANRGMYFLAQSDLDKKLMDAIWGPGGPYKGQEDKIVEMLESGASDSEIASETGLPVSEIQSYRFGYFERKYKEAQSDFKVGDNVMVEGVRGVITEIDDTLDKPYFVKRVDGELLQGFSFGVEDIKRVAGRRLTRKSAEPVFDFNAYEEYARNLTDSELAYAIKDAVKARDTANETAREDGHNPNSSSYQSYAKYADQVSVLVSERNRREGKQGSRKKAQSEAAINVGDKVVFKKPNLSEELSGEVLSIDPDNGWLTVRSLLMDEDYLVYPHEVVSKEASRDARRAQAEEKISVGDTVETVPLPVAFTNELAPITGKVVKKVRQKGFPVTYVIADPNGGEQYVGANDIVRKTAQKLDSEVENYIINLHQQGMPLDDVAELLDMDYEVVAKVWDDYQTDINLDAKRRDPRFFPQAT